MAKKLVLNYDELSREDIESLPEVQNDRSRLFCGILYEEDESQKFAIECLIKNKYKCLYIVHDRDKKENGESKKVHIHFVLKFPNARFLHSLAAELKIKPNYLQTLSSFNSYCAYLIHLDMPMKEQYLNEEVEGNLLREFNQAISTFDLEVVKVEKIFKYLEENDYHISRPKLLKWVCSNSLYDVYRRGYSIFNDILKEKSGLL